MPVPVPVPVAVAQAQRGRRARRHDGFNQIKGDLAPLLCSALLSYFCSLAAFPLLCVLGLERLAVRSFFLSFAPLIPVVVSVG